MHKIGFVFARLFSVCIGFAFFKIVAESVAPIDFSASMQSLTLAYVFNVIVDTGIVQYSYKYLGSGAKTSQDDVQSMRIWFHLFALPFLLVTYVVLFGENWGALISTALVYLTNLLNLDWLIFNSKKEKLWIIKSLASSGFGIGSSVMLVYFFQIPIFVILSQCFANIVGFIVSKLTLSVPKFSLKIPHALNLKTIICFGVSFTLVHIIYNLPTLVSDKVIGAQQAVVYVALYKTFSSLCVFLVPLIEFSTAKMYSSVEFASPRRALLKFVFQLMPWSFPILLIPNSIIINVLDHLLSLELLGVVSSDIVWLKLTLVLFVIEQGSVRVLTKISNRIAILYQLVAIGISGAMNSVLFGFPMYSLFLIIIFYQMALILMTVFATSFIKYDNHSYS